MRTLIKPVAIAVAKAALVALATYLSVFVFRLGWFIPLVVTGGAVAASLLTGGERRASSYPLAIGIVVVVSYLLMTIALFAALTDQVSYRTFAVAWHDKGKDNHTGESEIFLEFSDFLGMGWAYTRMPCASTWSRAARR